MSGASCGGERRRGGMKGKRCIGDGSEGLKMEMDEGLDITFRKDVNEGVRDGRGMNEGGVSGRKMMCG